MACPFKLAVKFIPQLPRGMKGTGFAVTGPNTVVTSITLIPVWQTIAHCPPPYCSPSSADRSTNSPGPEPAVNVSLAWGAWS